MGLRFRRNEQPATAESEEERLATIAPGVPGRCPACDGFGYIDHADLVSRTQVQHCRDCGQRWEYRFDGEGTLIELRELGEPGSPGRAARELDLTDRADSAPAHDDPAGDGTDADPRADDHPATDDHPAADDASDDDDVLDLTDEPVAHQTDTIESVSSPDGRSPAEWLREVAKRT